jgi:hypothetical protein
MPFSDMPLSMEPFPVSCRQFNWMQNPKAVHKESRKPGKNQEQAIRKAEEFRPACQSISLDIWGLIFTFSCNPG